jgi:2-methylisocitrate lyase-like PEP mutase family enzyme
MRKNQRNQNYMSDSVQAKRATFRALHQQGCLVLANPWDVGGIRRLEKLGRAKQR